MSSLIPDYLMYLCSTFIFILLQISAFRFLGKLYPIYRAGAMEIQEDWWKNPLAEDIHLCLRNKEDQLLAYSAQSPQLTYRRYLVDWVAVICEEFQLCNTAKHLAITLMDYFMDNYDIDHHLLKLVALGSLLVACE